MESAITELVHIVLRWVHLIAGIMWIGNSMLFNWLDRNLEKRAGAQGPEHIGQMWMVHSGGFYLVEKLMLPPGEMPSTLHWFKWQNGITWLSGISLMVLLFYMGNASLMIDYGVYPLTQAQAVGISVGSLVGAFVLYDRLWRSALGRRSPSVATAATVALVLAAGALYFNVYTGRAAFVHMGVLVGTLMTGNVWFCIIPSQRELIAATVEGRAQDPAISYQAKQRSVHNNYFTFPLLFVMLSGHFPSTFGGRYGYLVLTALALGSALIRHFMNIRFGRPGLGWLWASLAAGVLSLGVVFWIIKPAPTPSHRPVPWAEARGILQQRCTPCHSVSPTDAIWRVAPVGAMFDTPQQARALAQQVKVRVVVNRTMPFNNNQTGITEAERAALGAWVDQGAPIN
jgi:uncharacterized membrane protein